MKNFVRSAIILLLFFCKQAFSQSEWTAMTSGTTKNLYGCYFLDAQTGWAVGASGLILKTSNGGTSWSAVTTTITTELYAVFFVNNSTGWICGDAGKILKTTDGGTTWFPQSLGISISGGLKDVFFIDPTTGYIAGTYGVYKTSNGGTTWSLSHTSNSSQINAVRFKDAQNGWSTGLNGKIRTTTDGGTTWTQVNNSSSDDYYDLAITGGKTFFVGFNNEVLYTSNGGNSFTSITAPSDIHAIRFLNDNEGWFCGSNGKAYKTVDGGLTWAQSATGTSSTLKEIFFVNSNTGWCVGYNGRILKYTGSTVTGFSKANLSAIKVLNLHATSQLQLQQIPADQKVNIEVYNINGQLMLREETNGTDYTLDYDHLPAGVYLYQISSANGLELKGKLIK